MFLNNGLGQEKDNAKLLLHIEKIFYQYINSFQIILKHYLNEKKDNETLKTILIQIKYIKDNR